MAAEARQVHAGAGARVAQAVLRATTRADLTWRGDLRLVGQFLRRRLAQSPPLRAVAALLLMQVLLAPGVLAFLALRPAPVRPEIRLGLGLPLDEVGLRDAEVQLFKALPVPQVEDRLPGVQRRTPGRRGASRPVARGDRGGGDGSPGAGPGRRPCWLARAPTWGLVPPPSWRVPRSAISRSDRSCSRRSWTASVEAASWVIPRLQRASSSRTRAAARTAPEAELWRRATGRARGLGLVRDEAAASNSADLTSREAWLRAYAAVAAERGLGSPQR